MNDKMIQAILPLEEGELFLQIPSSLSQESYEDLEVWMTIFLKRMKRVSSAVKRKKEIEDELEWCGL